MVSLADIKSDLPHWDDDVIDQWLLKLANRGSDTGWPPPEPLEGAWKYILGHRPLSWWKNVSWKVEDSEFCFETLSRGTQLIVERMLDGYINGRASIYFGPDTKARLDPLVSYISKHGRLPRPVVAMGTDGLVVLDGNHRSAACHFCHLAANEIRSRGGAQLVEHQPIWIGTHGAGEMPI